MTDAELAERVRKAANLLQQAIFDAESFGLEVEIEQMKEHLRNLGSSPFITKTTAIVCNCRRNL